MATARKPIAGRAQYGLTAEMVREITVEIPGRHKEILSDRAPETPSQVRFSMPYCIAAALDQGNLGESDFSESAIARPEVGAVMRRVRFTGLPVTAADSYLATEEADRVTVVTDEGREHGIVVLHAKGDPHCPLIEEELLAKFDECAAEALSPQDLTAAKRLILAFEEQATLTDPTARLAPAEVDVHPTVIPAKDSAQAEAASRDPAARAG